MSKGTPVPHKPSDPESHLSAVIEKCAALLTRRPAVLITDIDGTISRIVPRPEDATVIPEAGAALERLAASLDVVAVITARDEATARRMVRAAGVTYVGNYGLSPGAPRVDAGGVAQARNEIQPLLREFPCVSLEDKGVAFALHYRNCENPGGARLGLLRLIEPAAQRAKVRILEGKKVIEVVPGGLPDKRDAFLGLLQKVGVRGFVYLGDDLSDVPVFNEIRELRRAGGPEGIGIAVIDAETDSSVVEAADLRVQGVDEAVLLLTTLAARFAR